MYYISEIAKLANRFLQLGLLKQLAVVLLVYIIVLIANLTISFYSFLALLAKIS